MRSHANSVCGFSGLEEDPTFEDHEANVKPGRLTQTPHYRVKKVDGVPVADFATPGMPGEACNPSGD